MLSHLDLFSGIGGFALAAKMAGSISTQQFVEIDPYCQKVLRKNFPQVPIHGDITTFAATAGEYDIITGGFPCQDISCANPDGRGLEGERSGLFFELMRVVRECRPRYIVLENVSEMLRKQRGRVMGTVLHELSQCGFDAEWQTISAASVGAPHLRKRVFIVAYPIGRRLQSPSGNREERSDPSLIDRKSPQVFKIREQFFVEVGAIDKAAANANCTGCQKFNTAALSVRQRFDSRRNASQRNPWGTEPGVLRVVDGVPCRVDRIRALGNAVVPQVALIPLLRVLDHYYTGADDAQG